MGNECSIDSLKNLIPEIDLGDLNPTKSVPNSYIEEDDEFDKKEKYDSKKILANEKDAPKDS